jgi:dolichyl-phosphate-mannose-protein mannosyltransferase
VRGVSRSAAPFLFLGLAFFLTMLLQRSFIVQSDEGYTLGAAWQIWNGRKMYEDFRQFVGPGSGYSVYFLWVLTGGPTFFAARVLSLLLSFSSIVAIYLILKSRGIRGLALAASVLAWVIAGAQYVMLNHNAFSSYAAAWLLFFLLRAQDRDRAGEAPRLRDHIFVGIAAGIVLLFLQTKGLILLAASAAFTLFAVRGKRGLRAAAVMVGGAVAVVAPLLLVWRPSVLLREWFLVPLTGEYLGHTGASRSLAVACVVVVGVVAAIAIRMRDRRLIAVAVTQVALLASTLHNVEAHHVAVNSFPLMVFVPLALQRYAALKRAPGEPPAPERMSATLLMAIVVAMFTVMTAVQPGRAMLKGSPLYVDFIRRPPRNIFPQPRVAAARAIYAGPFLPGLYFALGKKNPFFLNETTVCNDQACQLRLLAQIKEIKPEIAFLDYVMIRHIGLDENSPVDSHFREHYVPCRQDDYEGLLVRAVDASWCP